VVVRGGYSLREVLDVWTLPDVYDAWALLSLRDSLEAD
jgi:hypothetical protein